MIKITLCTLVVSCLLLACAGTPTPDTIASCPGAAPSDAGIESPIQSAGDPSRGAAVFANQCAKCHSRLVVERSSRLFRGYPRLDCPDYQASVSDGYLYRVITDGGPSVGLDAAMKPFATLLSEQEIADVVAYLRTAPR